MAGSQCCRFVLAAAMLMAGGGAVAEQGAQWMRVTHRMVMPHLEESLRYATTTGDYCMRGVDLSVLFPVLDTPSLAGCRLGLAAQSAGTRHHTLSCDNPDTATGGARVTHEAGVIRGALEITMGGKNMTFTQFFEAVPRGPCPAG